jgi:hypothetical protein
MTQPTTEATSSRRRAPRAQAMQGSSVHDITIPPTDPGRPVDSAASRLAMWIQERNETAVFHGLATALFTTLLLGWTVSNGQVPALHPHVGVLLLVLHLGAWVTGWLSFEATLDLSRAAQAGSLTDALPPRVTFVSVLSACALLLNTAMVIAAVLP